MVCGQHLKGKHSSGGRCFHLPESSSTDIHTTNKQPRVKKAKAQEQPTQCQSVRGTHPGLGGGGLWSLAPGRELVTQHGWVL